MSREDLASLCEAKNTICTHCHVESCEKCIVNQLVNEAFIEVSKNEENDEEIEI